MREATCVLHVLVKGELHPVEKLYDGRYRVLEDKGTYLVEYWAWSIQGLQDRVNDVEKHHFRQY